MLRNELFNQASQYNNDPVVIELNGTHVDIETVKYERGCVVLVLSPEDLHVAVTQVGGSAGTQ